MKFDYFNAYEQFHNIKNGYIKLIAICAIILISNMSIFLLYNQQHSLLCLLAVLVLLAFSFMLLYAFLISVTHQAINKDEKMPIVINFKNICTKGLLDGAKYIFIGIIYGVLSLLPLIATVIYWFADDWVEFDDFMNMKTLVQTEFFAGYGSLIGLFLLSLFLVAFLHNAVFLYADSLKVKDAFNLKKLGSYLWFSWWRNMLIFIAASIIVNFVMLPISIPFAIVLSIVTVLKNNLLTIVVVFFGYLIMYSVSMYFYVLAYMQCADLFKVYKEKQVSIAKEA